MRKLPLLSLAGALVLSSGAALAQSNGTTLSETVQDRAAIREMVREMMNEMMSQGPQRPMTKRPERAQRMAGDDTDARPGRRDNDGRDWRRRHDWKRDHPHGMMGQYGMMGPHEMMDGPRRGMEPYGMMHGPRPGMGPGMLHGARGKILFALLDANGDGAVTLQEMNDLHERIFNAMDRNDDGGVTRGEIRAFFGTGSAKTDQD